MDHTTLPVVCDLFDLGSPIGAPTPVSGGLTNRLWRVTTTNGVFAVKEMNRDPDRADYVAWFDRAFTLEQAAFHAGIPMPRPVPIAPTGRCLGEIRRPDGGPITVRIHEWIDGEPLSNGEIYPSETSARVAVILANIHALGQAAEIAATEALRIFGNEHWSALADRADAESASWAHEFPPLLQVLRELEAYVIAAQSDATPLVLSHRDSDMKNFLRTPAGELVLVDWDAAGPVNPRHDLANEALVWAGVHLGDPDATIAGTFVDAYRSASGMDAAFQATDLAELVSLRLAWFEFNVHRALGERIRGDSDRQLGENAVRRNVEQLPRFARSLDAWLAILTK